MVSIKQPSALIFRLRSGGADLTKAPVRAHPLPMYRLIGHDQKEYGPISLEQLKLWLAEGRIGPDTQISLDGTSQWRPLSTYPELSSLATPGPLPSSPFSAPPVDDASARKAAADAVKGPAIGLIVTAGLGFAMCLLGIVMALLGVGKGSFNMQSSGMPADPEFVQMMQKFQAVQGPLAVVQYLFQIGVCVVILLGALKMKNLQNRGWAMTAAILAIVPCVSPCCCIGIPIGIWALTTLNQPGVKQAYE